MESYVIPDKLNKQIFYNITYIVTQSAGAFIAFSEFGYFLLMK